MSASPAPGPAAPGARYLLFAGRHGTAGGLADLVGVFGAEPDARGAFTRVRLRSRGSADWAELAAIDARGRVQVLCWFGHERPVPLRAAVAAPAAVSMAAPARRAFWRRSATQRQPRGRA